MGSCYYKSIVVGINYDSHDYCSSIENRSFDSIVNQNWQYWSQIGGIRIKPVKLFQKELIKSLIFLLRKF